MTDSLSLSLFDNNRSLRVFLRQNLKRLRWMELLCILFFLRCFLLRSRIISVTILSIRLWIVPAFLGSRDWDFNTKKEWESRDKNRGDEKRDGLRHVFGEGRGWIITRKDPFSRRVDEDQEEKQDMFLQKVSFLFFSSKSMIEILIETLFSCKTRPTFSPFPLLLLLLPSSLHTKCYKETDKRKQFGP